MAKMVIGSFSNWEDAEGAIRELEQQGYAADNLSVISKEQSHDGADMAADAATGAAEGAVTGGAIGGLAGLLAGAGVFPAIAGLFFGGPIVAALGLTGAVATAASGAVTGAVVGGLAGALVKLGLSEEEAKAYEQDVQDGAIIIGANAEEGKEGVVRDLFEDHHAIRTNEVEAR